MAGVMHNPASVAQQLVHPHYQSIKHVCRLGLWPIPVTSPQHLGLQPAALQAGPHTTTQQPHAWRRRSCQVAVASMPASDVATLQRGSFTSSAPDADSKGSATEGGDGSKDVESDLPATSNGGGDAADGAGVGKSMDSMRLTIQFIRSIDQVSQAEWDALATAAGEVNPFTLWTFLHALETSGSAAADQGWLPQHAIVRNEATGELIGACPLYLKSHSYGEYVFDSSWANAAQRVGIRYYPKLQSCVPFSPVTGQRLLVVPGPLQPAITRALAGAMLELSERLGLSGVHMTFNTADESAALARMGFQQRMGIQFHWENRGYKCFEDFLADLKQSKRKNIRQERKSAAKQGLTIRRLVGSEVTSEMWDTFYGFYTNTVDSKWGTAYLTSTFFHDLGRAMPDKVLLVVAEEEGRMVAAALNLIGSHALYGRNWGCEAGREFKHLHFELCYYQAIEEAIARGLPRVEAGAQGEHKLSRGYLPSFTHSAHYLADPGLRGAVDRFLDNERKQIEYTWTTLSLEASPFKTETTYTAMLSKFQNYQGLLQDSRRIDTPNATLDSRDVNTTSSNGSSSSNNGSSSSSGSLSSTAVESMDGKEHADDGYAGVTDRSVSSMDSFSSSSTDDSGSDGDATRSSSTSATATKSTDSSTQGSSSESGGSSSSSSRTSSDNSSSDNRAASSDSSWRNAKGGNGGGSSGSSGSSSSSSSSGDSQESNTNTVQDGSGPPDLLATALAIAAIATLVAVALSNPDVADKLSEFDVGF